MQVLDKTAESVLTLITCFPFSYIGPSSRAASWCARVRCHLAREKIRDSARISRKAQTIRALTRKCAGNPRIIVINASAGSGEFHALSRCQNAVERLT